MYDEAIVAEWLVDLVEVTKHDLGEDYYAYQRIGIYLIYLPIKYHDVNQLSCKGHNICTEAFASSPTFSTLWTHLA